MILETVQYFRHSDFGSANGRETLHRFLDFHSKLEGGSQSEHPSLLPKESIVFFYIADKLLGYYLDICEEIHYQIN